MTAISRQEDVDRFISDASEPRRLTIRFIAIDLDDLRQIVASPKAAHVRSIYISGPFGDEAVNILAEAPNLSSITDLTVSSSSPGELTPAGLGTLANAQWPLESLTISRNGHLGDEGLRALSRARWLDSLQRLAACSIGATSDGVENFFSVVTLPRLERFALGSDQWRLLDPKDAIGDRGVTAITRVALPSLSYLKLEAAGITDDGAIALGAWHGLAHIRTLDLSRNAITAVGLEALLASPHARKIEELGIGSNPCGPSYWIASDYDGSITASGVEDDEQLAHITEYVTKKLGHAVRVW
jgi:hypothetical protein